MITTVNVQKIATAYTSSGAYVSIEFNDDINLVANIDVSDVAALAHMGYAFSAFALKQNVAVQLYREHADTAYTITRFNVNSPIED